MNVKTILIAIGSAIIGILSFIFFGKSRRRNGRNIDERSDKVRNDIDKSVAANTDAQRRTEELHDTAGKLEESIDKLTESVETAGSITDDIESSTEQCLDIIQRAKQNAKKR